MKIGHWTMFNESGMNQVAKTMVAAERALGLDSHICNIQNDKDWGHMEDCDIHVAHTHFPDSMRRRLTKPFRLVWVGHGTPEHVFQWSYEQHQRAGWGQGDSFMLMQHFLKTAHARVTFWERHLWYYRSLLPQEAKVHLVPMGVDLDFWRKGESQGKYAGNPSVFTAENPHPIKWPLDLFMAWPSVWTELDGACLHAMYVTQNTHRWFAPLINANGASYAMHWGGGVTDHAGLRNIFKSTDFYIGLVRYGDFNRIALEANAAGQDAEWMSCKTISYAGNPYSDFWVPEGDQRVIAAELVKILSHQVEPRQKARVPDQSDMVKAMIPIYESILPPVMRVKPLRPELLEGTALERTPLAEDAGLQPHLRPQHNLDERKKNGRMPDARMAELALARSET